MASQLEEFSSALMHANKHPQAGKVPMRATAKPAKRAGKTPMKGKAKAKKPGWAG